MEGCVEQYKWLSTCHNKNSLRQQERMVASFSLKQNKEFKPTKKKQVFKNSLEGLSAALQSLGRKSEGVGTYT